MTRDDTDRSVSFVRNKRHTFRQRLLWGMLTVQIAANACRPVRFCSPCLRSQYRHAGDVVLSCCSNCEGHIGCKDKTAARSVIAGTPAVESKEERRLAQAARGLKQRSSNPARVVRCQERHHRRDIVRLSESPKRRALEHAFLEVATLNP